MAEDDPKIAFKAYSGIPEATMRSLTAANLSIAQVTDANLARCVALAEEIERHAQALQVCSVAMFYVSGVCTGVFLTCLAFFMLQRWAWS